MMGLTLYYKTAGFALVFAVLNLKPYPVAAILLVLHCVSKVGSFLRHSVLPHLENKRSPYGNSTSSFDFELFIVIDISAPT